MCSSEIVSSEIDFVEHSFDNKYFTASNGYGNRVKVKFEYGAEVPEYFGSNPLINLKDIVMRGRIKCSSYLNNRLSYVPRLVFLYVNDDGGLRFTHEMLGKNAYGAESQTTCILRVTSNGGLVFLTTY